MKIKESISKHRQRLLLKTGEGKNYLNLKEKNKKFIQKKATPTVLENNKKLHDYQLTSDCEIIFRDLGLDYSSKFIKIMIKIKFKILRRTNFMENSIYY